MVGGNKKENTIQGDANEGRKCRRTEIARSPRNKKVVGDGEWDIIYCT
jgi:hypothetical protein